MKTKMINRIMKIKMMMMKKFNRKIIKQNNSMLRQRIQKVNRLDKVNLLLKIKIIYLIKEIRINNKIVNKTKIIKTIT